MPKRRNLILLLILTILSSCGLEIWTSNYDFETTAIYIAPKSKARAYVLTNGYVPKDADLSDGFDSRVNTTITFPGNLKDTIKILSSGKKVLCVEINHKQILITDSSNYPLIMKECFNLIPISKTSENELKELSDVILSTSLGPKGTYLKGQTKDINVDTVFFKSKNR